MEKRVRDSRRPVSDLNSIILFRQQRKARIIIICLRHRPKRRQKVIRMNRCTG